MQFDNFIGNEKVKEQLSKFDERGAFPHAMLIEGEDAEKCRRLALLLAQRLVCSTADGEKPCGHCAACIKVAGGVHPDIAVVDGGEKNKSIAIDKIRQLRDDIFILPNEAEKKVVIIENAHNLSVQAQNALLKSIEEPPGYVVFILLCTSRLNMLETIRSRVVNFTLDDGMPENSDVFSALSADERNTVNARTDALCVALATDSEMNFLKAVSFLETEKALVEPTLETFKMLLHRALLHRALLHRAPLSGAGAGPGEVTAGVSAVRDKLGAGKIIDIIYEVEKLQNMRKFNMNHTLFITLLCANVWEIRQR